MLINAEKALEEQQKEREREVRTVNQLKGQIGLLESKGAKKELASLHKRVASLAARLGVEKKVFVAHEALDDVEDKVVQLVESLVQERFKQLAVQRQAREEKEMGERRAGQREVELQQALRGVIEDRGECFAR